MKVYIIIISGIIAIIAVVAIFVWLREKKRTEAMKELAGSLKFSFSKKGDDSLLSSLNRFHLFSQGHLKRVSNVMKGYANDIHVTIMDYRYTIWAGKSSHTWKQTVILFQSSLLQLPAFALRPENLFHKIGAAFSYQDIDFDSHPTFSKQYLLQGAEDEAVRNTFSDDLLAYYEQRKDLSTEGDGDKLLFYRISKRLSPMDIRSFMEQGFALFSLVKTES